MGLCYSGAAQGYAGESKSSASQTGLYGGSTTGGRGLFGIASWGIDAGKNDHDVAMIGDYQGTWASSTEYTFKPSGPSYVSSANTKTPEGHLYVG